MATYSKETALYQTDGIKDDIEDAKNNAKGYMTDISNNGVFVHEYDTTNPEPSDTGVNGVHISNKVDIVRNGQSVAEFGETVRVGKSSTARFEISSDKLEAVSGPSAYSTKYFTVGDSGNATAWRITDTFPEETSEGNKTYTTSYMPISKPTLLINGENTPYVWTDPGNVIATYVYEGDVVSIQYNTYRANGYFTFGTRNTKSEIGDSSFSEGITNTSSGVASHAEGIGTIASGWATHAEGTDSKALGDYSHAHGRGTVAVGWAQTAIGEYNIPNGSEHEIPDPSAPIFIIGNGEDNENRSNAFTVDWDGNVNAAGTFFGSFKIPCARWTGTTTSNLSGTTGTEYNFNQFTGHSASIATNDNDIFEVDPNGMKVKKTGWYLFTGNVHMNSAGNGNMMRCTLYDYDAQVNLASPNYAYQNSGFSSHNSTIVAYVNAGDRIIYHFCRYSGTQAFRPTSAYINAIMLAPFTG